MIRSPLPMPQSPPIDPEIMKGLFLRIPFALPKAEMVSSITPRISRKILPVDMLNPWDNMAANKEVLPGVMTGRKPITIARIIRKSATT